MVDAAIRAAGFTFTGLCQCTARIKTYKHQSGTIIKHHLSGRIIKLIHNRVLKNATTYEHFQEIIDEAKAISIDGGTQRSDQTRVRS